MLRATAAPTPPPPARGRGAVGGWGADIMRTWRQTAVRQATNEELIARFLRGCDLLGGVEGGGGDAGVWCWVLGGGWWCYKEVIVVTKRGLETVIKCKRWWEVLLNSVCSTNVSNGGKFSVTGGKISFQKRFCEEDIYSFHHRDTTIK